MMVASHRFTAMAIILSPPSDSQLIQDDGSWAEAAAAALVNGDGSDGAGGGQEGRLEILLQRTQRWRFGFDFFTLSRIASSCHLLDTKCHPPVRLHEVSRLFVLVSCS